MLSFACLFIFRAFFDLNAPYTIIVSFYFKNWLCQQTYTLILKLRQSFNLGGLTGQILPIEMKII